jgi:hypothetical protein
VSCFMAPQTKGPNIMVKKSSNKRLLLDREVVRTLVVELADDQLRYVNGALRPGSDSSHAACGCYSAELVSC